MGVGVEACPTARAYTISEIPDRKHRRGVGCNGDTSNSCTLKTLSASCCFKVAISAELLACRADAHACTMGILELFHESLIAEEVL